MKLGVVAAAAVVILWRHFSLLFDPVDFAAGRVDPATVAVASCVGVHAGLAVVVVDMWQLTLDVVNRTVV